MSRHRAVVLAAGGSRRLGRPKQLLTREGETLVHRAVRLALATGPAHAWVVVGAHADTVAGAVRDLPCEVVANPEWTAGVGASLAAVSARVATGDGPVLLVACDQPALEASHLQALLDAARAVPGQCAATRYGDALGIPAVVPAGWFLTRETPGADFGFGARLRARPEGDVGRVDAPLLGFDIDTPEDLRDAIAHGWVDND